MANVLTISFSANYVGNGLTASNSASGTAVSIASNEAPQGVNEYTVPTAGENIPLGAVTAPRYLIIQNVDPTNYMTVYTASAGTPFPVLKPGDILIVPLDSTITAPWWQAHTAGVLVNYRVYPT